MSIDSGPTAVGAPSTHIVRSGTALESEVAVVALKSRSAAAM